MTKLEVLHLFAEKLRMLHFSVIYNVDVTCSLLYYQGTVSLNIEQGVPNVSQNDEENCKIFKLQVSY